MGALHPAVQPSHSDGLALAKAALERPDVSCLYIGLTRESAKRIMLKYWQPAER